jgi:topoisomerase (DNA) II binding protein 1
VHLSWLEACEAELGVAEEEPHLVAPSCFVAEPVARERGAPRDDKAETSSRRGGERPEEKAPRRGLREVARGRADRAPEFEPRRRGGDPAAPNPLTRAALAKEAEAEAMRAAAAADQNRPPDAGASEFPATGTELPATAFAVPETANGVPSRHGIAGMCAFAEGGDEGGGNSAAAAVFRGARIALSPLLSREEEDAAREFISAGSGIAVAVLDPKRGFAPVSAKYVVCPAAPTAEERRALLAVPAAERAKQVTCHWLETCVQQERVVELTEPAGKSAKSAPVANPAYRPLPCDAPLPSMQSLRISTSTYDERIKASVHMLCHLLGARYTDRLGRNKNTHLVAPAAEGAKYTAAVSWGIHVVTVEWLHACVAAGERVDEAGFAPPPPSPPPPEPDDETEAPGGSGSGGSARGRRRRRRAFVFRAGDPRRRRELSGLAASARVAAPARRGAPGGKCDRARESLGGAPGVSARKDGGGRRGKRRSRAAAAGDDAGAGARARASSRVVRAREARPAEDAQDAQDAQDARVGARKKRRARDAEGHAEGQRRRERRRDAFAARRRALAAAGGARAGAGGGSRPPRRLAVRREHDRRRRGGHTRRGLRGNSEPGRRRRRVPGPRRRLRGARARVSVENAFPVAALWRRRRRGRRRERRREASAGRALAG